MHDIDTVVVGAGVVGLAAAAAIATRGHSVCVLEREPRPGLGGSSHNSSVIHAGIYYPPGSLKARTCVDGAAQLYHFCRTQGVPHARCGKLLVARDESEIPALERLAETGSANGAAGLEMVGAEFVRAREPHVHAAAALFSPNTGIVDTDAFVRALVRQCETHDVVVLWGTSMVNADVSPSHVEIDTGRERIHARSVVNAAGLFADDVSAALGGEQFRIHPCRGEYAELIPARRSLVNGLVYPVPHAGGHGLGVHVTKTIQGSVSLGPTARYQLGKEDYERDRLSVDEFLEPARRLLPGLVLADLRPGASGIRAKLHGPEESFADFLIARDDECPRLIQAAGIESPGLTASLAIADLVSTLADEILG